jgi:lysophospholipase L1-like esterase
MKKKAIIFAMAALLLLGLYLNRSYAYIYNFIAVQNLVDHLTPKITEHNYAKDSQASPLWYVALGDSLTAGVGTENYQQSYPFLLADALAKEKKQNWRLLNLAVPGAESADVLSQQLPAMLKQQPQLITLLVGTNDIHNFISEQKFADNYRQILEQLKTKTAARIIVLTVPNIGYRTLVLPPYNWYFANRAQVFNKIIKKLCQEYQIGCFDLAQTSRSILRARSNYSRDLFHPSANGYYQWFNKIYAAINF